MLTGKTLSETSNARRSARGAWDKTSLIFKEFKKRGYRTQYTCDRHVIKKFLKPPTDIFSLPMSESLMSTPLRQKYLWQNECFDDKPESEVWLGLVKQFLKNATANSSPFFSLNFFARPTHHYPNKAASVDEFYFNLFKDLYESSVLENTVVVFFGDHGAHFGASHRRTG